MPIGRRMTAVDECTVRSPLAIIFALAAEVELWPALLAHYRFVRFHERQRDGGGLVEMSANRPFGVVRWPTWWTSVMQVTPPDGRRPPSIRFRHVRGVTTGMDVEWSFNIVDNGSATHVRILHLWDGPPVPLAGPWVARGVIGPVFVHGIAARTLAGLARAAERLAGTTAADIHNL
jgi:hypothetical protein